jgi:hypothetical protein
VWAVLAGGVASTVVLLALLLAGAVAAGIGSLPLLACAAVVLAAGTAGLFAVARRAPSLGRWLSRRHRRSRAIVRLAAAVAGLSHQRSGSGSAAGVLAWTGTGLLADAGVLAGDERGRRRGRSPGGLLTTYASWRWVLFVNVPIGLAAALAAPRVLRESARQRGRFDLPGAITGTGGIAALVYGLTNAATSPNGVSHWGDAKVVASLAASVVLLAAFAVTEARSQHPCCRCGCSATATGPARTSPERPGEFLLAASASRGPSGSYAAMGSRTRIARCGGTTRPPGRISPMSSNTITPLHSRLHPCSG